MKKFLCVLLSAILVAGTATLIPASAATKKPSVSLKSKSATLKITKKKSKTVYGTTTIKVNKAKGVKIKKTAFKSSDKKIAKVSKGGKVTAVKKGKATIKVSVKYTLKKRTYTKSLSFKVTVKDERKKAAPIVPVTNPAEETETVTEPVTEPLTEPVSESATEPQTEELTETDPTVTESRPDESETCIMIPTETDTETETEPTETDTEPEPATETTTETATETETEPTETEPATETATETETEPTETETTAVTETVENTEPPTELPTETTGDTAVAKRLNDVPATSGYSHVDDADFLGKLSQFSNKLYVMSAKDESDNYVMSPASVYMAMAMLYYVGDEGVQNDVKELVGMSDEQIAKTGELFRSLCRKLTKWSMMDDEYVPVGELSLTNSIWLNEGEKADEATLKKLAEELYCHAYETPFMNNNKAANNAVREFIKEQTNGLIDKDFELSEETIFALINTLYLKDIWGAQKLFSGERQFTTPDGVIQTDFLYGDYFAGRVQETDKCTYFHTITDHGYRIKFVLPKDGCTLKEAMSQENLNAVLSDKDFDPYDNNDRSHLTRCIFPAFHIDSDTNLKQILAENGLMQNSFLNFFSPLFDNTPLKVSDIKHTTSIDVNEEGIEGAAVTIISGEATGADPSTLVYHDFIIDKSFGFIVANYEDVVLFEGQVVNPAK